MSEMKVYRRLETPNIFCNSYALTMSDTGVLTQGDLVTHAQMTMQCIIEDSTGEVVDELANMTEGDDGKWTYSGYTIPLDANLGIWNYECRCTVSSKVTTERGSFEVKEQTA